MTASKLFYYLVERNNATGHTHVRAFPITSDEAFREYFRLERSALPPWGNPGDADIEVVLIVASSERELREGYPHLFSEGTRTERQERFIEQIDQMLAV